MASDKALPAFRRALTADIKRARDIKTGKKLTRREVASRMTNILRVDVNPSMINNWTAISHKKHHMPAEYLPAFAQATGGQRALSKLVSMCGYCMTSHVQSLKMEIEKLRSGIKRREILLQEVEGK